MNARAIPLLLALLAPVVGRAQDSSATNRPVPRDTLDAVTYDGWKHYATYCDRCHGQDARGTSFGPDLVEALGSQGSVPSEEAFVAIMASGRPDRGMPPAATLGLEPQYFHAVYSYLQGRGQGRFHGGRPALKEQKSAP